MKEASERKEKPDADDSGKNKVKLNDARHGRPASSDERPQNDAESRQVNRTRWFLHLPSDAGWSGTLRGEWQRKTRLFSGCGHSQRQIKLLAQNLDPNTVKL